MIQKDKNNKGFKRLKNSFKYAFEGLVLVYKREQTLGIMAVISFIILILGFLFKISYFEWIVILLLVCLVNSLEFINTSIEFTVDLLTKERNILAKHSKDTASSAVLIASIFSSIIGLMIFIPKIVSIFK